MTNSNDSGFKAFRTADCLYMTSVMNKRPDQYWRELRTPDIGLMASIMAGPSEVAPLITQETPDCPVVFTIMTNDECLRRDIGLLTGKRKVNVKQFRECLVKLHRWVEEFTRERGER